MKGKIEYLNNTIDGLEGNSKISKEVQHNNVEGHGDLKVFFEFRKEYDVDIRRIHERIDDIEKRLKEFKESMIEYATLDDMSKLESAYLKSIDYWQN